MENIAEAIRYIRELAVAAEKPIVIDIEGNTYCDKNLVRYGRAPLAEPISATTLTSLIDYVRENRGELRENMFIHIVSPTRVELYSGLLKERDREKLFVANALLPEFEYDHEYDQEAFIIAMQTCFEPTDDRPLITAFASNLVCGKTAEYSDDGITQQAVVKTGITTKENAAAPNPVTLTPYRTFLEVEQPSSAFVFRIKERGGVPTFKLVEADGGTWRSKAVAGVKDFIADKLASMPDLGSHITILA